MPSYLNRKKRSVKSLPLTFSLEESPLTENMSSDGNLVANIKPFVASTWRQSIRRVGGYWMATCQWHGSNFDKKMAFMQNFMRQISVKRGNTIKWQGFVGEMIYTTPWGVPYVRSWDGLANKIKTLYTRVYPNLLSDGSAESAAWTDVNTPTTNEQSETWRTHGTYSNWVIADSANDGSMVENNIAVTAGLGYSLSMAVNIISGSWRLEVYEQGSGVALGSRDEDETGETIMSCSIDETSTYTGNVGIRIKCLDTAGEIYCDNCVFQRAAVTAETKWYEDTTSQDQYGIIEEILLEGGLDQATARALAQTELAERAWANPKPPSSSNAQPNPDNQAQLDMTLLGYVFTLRNKHSIVTGTNGMSTQISDILANSQFITAGEITTNAVEHTIDDRAQLRQWEIIEDIIQSGDSSGNRWEGGVWRNREFDYRIVNTDILYRYKRGVVQATDGSEVLPWNFIPGRMKLNDMPIFPGNILSGDNVTSDMRVAYLDETTFDMADWLAGGSGIAWQREIR